MVLLHELIADGTLTGPDDNDRYICACGSIIKSNSLSSHMKSAKHRYRRARLSTLDKLTNSVDRDDLHQFNICIDEYLVETRRIALPVDIAVNLYRRAISNTSWQIATELLRMGGCPDSRREIDLIKATQYKQHGFVLNIITICNPNIHTNNELPLRWAIHNKDISMISLFIDNGADLHTALTNEHFRSDKLLFLIENGYTCRSLEDILPATVETATNRQLHDMLNKSVTVDKLADRIKILRRLISLDVQECSICMSEQDAHYKCTTCPNSICVQCRDSLIVKKCPYCRTVW